MRKCECCHKEVEKVSVHASLLGPFSFGYCNTCDENHAEPRYVLENIVRNKKCIHGTKAEWVRKSMSVYYNNEYVNMQKFLDDNKERFIVEYGIDRNEPIWSDRELKALIKAGKIKDSNPNPPQSNS